MDVPLSNTQIVGAVLVVIGLVVSFYEQKIPHYRVIQTCIGLSVAALSISVLLNAFH